MRIADYKLGKIRAEILDDLYKAAAVPLLTTTRRATPSTVSCVTTV